MWKIGAWLRSCRWKFEFGSASWKRRQAAVQAWSWGGRGGRLRWLGCRSGCWQEFWFRGLWLRRFSKKGFVREHLNDEDGVARADFVAGGGWGFFYARAVGKSSIAALQVEDAAAFFAVFDGEVEAGHEFIVGEGVVGFGGAADAERLAGV